MGMQWALFLLASACIAGNGLAGGAGRQLPAFVAPGGALVGSFLSSFGGPPPAGPPPLSRTAGTAGGRAGARGMLSDVSMAAKKKVSKKKLAQKEQAEAG